MREIIEIDKDFNLNTIKHSKKIKPNSKIKGKVNISLYDEKNNLVRDIHTENLIMDWFKNETYERGFVDLVGKNAYKNSNMPSNPFGYLILSDQDVEEDSKNPFIMKNTIGFAQRRTTYSGSSTTQGAYNSVESKTYIDEEGNFVCHEVYDFPTHASNGTINSLMWATANSNSSHFNLRHDYFSNAYGKPSTMCFYDYVQDFMYFFDSQILRRVNFAGESYANLSTLKNESGTNFNSSDMLGVPYYYISRNTVSGALYNNTTSAHNGLSSANFLFANWGTDGSIVGESKQYTGTQLAVTINGESYVIDKYACYDGGEYIYYTVAKSTDKNYKGVVKARFSDGSVVKTFAFDTSCGSTSNGVIAQFNDDCSMLRFYCGNIDCNLDSDLNIIQSFSTVRPATLIAGTDNAYGVWTYSTSGSYYHIKIMDNPVTTYVKLTNPVTKTNTNTMKVQYDFVIECPNVIGTIMKKV